MAVRSENGERLVAVFVLKVLFGHAEVFGEFLFRQIVNGSGKEEEAAVLTGTAIAMDGIAVIVNNDNPLEELTGDQVRDIYTGDVTEWDAL